ncbi:inactive leucine-rich repeat receptor-like serine/threonine-protein kinase At1g60630 isoform X2 [Amaranthus tricolor]|uniref:inactive leucine-rich repeat receptor-like serine/threonine-protein kinase At1g60630 isoform X2 n=1 Tax=Amaranthus tricolor TaxID=29722 RepID=UPI002585DA5F|nr:inactive leucine-rich repeat receptor-like serine/threonine-protein kinase At1g60630 isoform X2 [Amaranthus tricolor]
MHLIFLLLCVILPSSMAEINDANALLDLKSTIDPQNSLPWNKDSDPCTWEGVKECIKGRVSKLVVENSYLTGTINGGKLSLLSQLRVLSFKSNNLTGNIPDMSRLFNLKVLYLNLNEFTGPFPNSLSSLHRLKTIVLSNNKLSGKLPSSISEIPRLYMLYLDGNQFTGEIPELNQTSLKFLNLSNNRFSGEIPRTVALLQFNKSSFMNNVDLCGVQIECNLGPAMSIPPLKRHHNHRLSHKTKIILIAGISGGIALILIGLVLGIFFCKRRPGRSGKKNGRVEETGPSALPGEEREKGEPSGGERKGGFSWEGDKIGKLVFIGEEEMNYDMEDLLKASAETLGRGRIGSTYKAVMESGYIVTVKRLKDATYPRLDEFTRHLLVLGRLKHPNIVPLRAYFQAKEERLLVFDYFPNGSLFSLLHGNRPSGGGKPLHWTSCLKIAEDLATGLLYIHQNFGLVHGNLKSSNVLLGSDFESCLTDYGLHSFRNPESAEEPSTASLFYSAPECRDYRKLPTQQADVYSFGVLLLELMTGRTPFQDLVEEHGTDIPKWVKSVREEETESGEGSSGNETSEEKLRALLSIAMACVAVSPKSRPEMKDVLRMIRDTRAEAHISSNNSSDHSPGRWSDTVQSLPREEHLSI